MMPKGFRTYKRKLGIGNHYFQYQGKRTLIRPGQTINCPKSALGAFTEQYDLVTGADVQKAEAGTPLKTPRPAVIHPEVVPVAKPEEVKPEIDPNGILAQEDPPPDSEAVKPKPEGADAPETEKPPDAEVPEGQDG
jgi:hypothetical protein